LLSAATICGNGANPGSVMEIYTNVHQIKDMPKKISVTLSIVSVEDESIASHRHVVL
jgi:hypothetical protein